MGKTGATMPKRNARAFGEVVSVTCAFLSIGPAAFRAPTSATNGEDRYRQCETADPGLVASTTRRAPISCARDPRSPEPGSPEPKNRFHRVQELIKEAQHCHGRRAAGPSPTLTIEVRPLRRLRAIPAA